MPWKLSLIWILFVASFSANAQEFRFDGQLYRQASSLSQGNAKLFEYVRDGESLATWNQLISVQIHSGATRISDVMNPYAAARKPLLLRDTGVFRRTGSTHAEDVVFEFMLRAPDGSHIEIAFVRAISDPGEPVLLYVFSKRIPTPDQATAESGLRAASAKRSAWISALGELSAKPTTTSAP